MLIDTHAHLNFKAFDKDLVQVIKRAVKAKVVKIIIPGAKITSSKKAIEIAQKYKPCFATVGIHPHHTQNLFTTILYSNKVEIIKSQLIKLAKDKKVVAIGEIGLDYYVYRKHPPISDKAKKHQKKLFILQLDIALKLKLPVIFHCRQAYNDLLELLKSFLDKQNKKISGVFHCFQGKKKHLQKALNLGFYIGFGGNTTYSENKKVRALVKATPLDRLLLETDSPFLTPVPLRRNRNEPAYLQYIALQVAKIKEKKIESITKTTSKNALKLFNL